MTKPVRLQLSRKKGFNLQARSETVNGLQVINVARPSIWGNPFIHENASEAVEAFRLYCQGGTHSFAMGPGKLQFAKNSHACSLHWSFPDYVKGHLKDLCGKNLACWCGSDEPCHADVLLELANPPLPAPHTQEER